MDLYLSNLQLLNRTYGLNYLNLTWKLTQNLKNLKPIELYNYLQSLYCNYLNQYQSEVEVAYVSTLYL